MRKETEHDSERENTSIRRDQNKKLWMIIASQLLIAPTLQPKCDGDCADDSEDEGDRGVSSSKEKRTEQARSVLALLEGGQPLH